jgi:hypothetical protein
MRFARRVFTGAGLWGLIVLTPLYFTFDLVGRQYPPPITHPDLYYGFIGVGVAWQVGFLVIGRDPVRFRAMMIPAVLEKFIFVLSQSALYAQGRVRPGQLAVAGPDFVLGILFIVSFFVVDNERRRSAARTPETIAHHGRNPVR